MTTIATETDPVADFDSFYGANFRGIVVMIYSYTGDMAAAQDIAQEAFCRVWQRWQRVSRYDDPLAWVRRVSYHLAHSRWRRLKVAAAYVVKQRLEEVAPLDPDHVAVVAALRKLPRAQREALVLHYMMDLPISEVAEYLEVPMGTVKSWLHRGRAALAVDLGIEAREDIVAPPAEKIMADARRRRRAAIATVVVVMLVAGLLVAIQMIRPQRNPPPVTPSPSIMDSSLQTVGWPGSTIHFDVTHPGCPAGTTVLDAPNGWPRARFANATGVAFGDLTGDGEDEAVLTVSCQASADDTPVTGLLMVVQRRSDHALHVLGWPGSAQSDFWIDAGTLYADAAGRVNGWRWSEDSFAPVDTSTRYPEYEPATDARWLLLDGRNQPYLVAIKGKGTEISLVVLDRVNGGWQVVSTVAVKGPGPARIVGRVADPSVNATGRKDMRLTVVEVSTPGGAQLFRWRQAQLTAVVAH